MESSLGNFYRHLAIFSGHTGYLPTYQKCFKITVFDSSLLRNSPANVVEQEDDEREDDQKVHFKQFWGNGLDFIGKEPRLRLS